MAITRQTNLPQQMKHFGDRELRWLWELMNNEGAELGDWHTANGTIARQNIIARAIAGHSDPQSITEHLRDSTTEALIDIRRFDWIDAKSDRLLIWLLTELKYSQLWLSDSCREFIPEAVPREDRKDLVISLIDRASNIKKVKLQWLANAKDRWVQSATPESLTKWINLDDETQLKWALNYLTDRGKARYRFSPLDNRDYYAAVLSTLDHISRENPDSAALLIIRMKRNWSQKKWRDFNNSKITCQISLNRDAKKMLDKLARKSGVTLSELVERQIRDAFHSD